MAKDVFTTGEAAKACKVSQQTIIRCFDSGQLKGFRVPGSRFRRIPRDVLYRFMKDNGIPTDALDKKVVALIFAEGKLAECLTKECKETHEVHCSSDPFNFGMMMVEKKPDTIIVDCNTEAGVKITRMIQEKYPDIDLVPIAFSAALYKGVTTEKVVRVAEDETPERIAERVAQHVRRAA